MYSLILYLLLFLLQPIGGNEKQVFTVTHKSECDTILPPQYTYTQEEQITNLCEKTVVKWRPVAGGPVYPVWFDNGENKAFFIQKKPMKKAPAYRRIYLDSENIVMD